MHKVMDIVRLVEVMAPPQFKAPWDNCGLLVGDPEGKASGVIVAMDVTEELIDRAALKGVNVLVTHHPLIFRPLTAVTADTPTGQLVMKSLAKGIHIIAAHTTFDAGPGGVNTILAETLGLANPTIPPGDNEDLKYTRIGRWEKGMSLQELLAKVNEALRTPHLRWTGPAKEVYHRGMVAAGSGSFAIDISAQYQVDVLITGDMRYHDAQRAFEQSITVIDAGHYATEAPALHAMARWLSGYLSIPVDVEDGVSFPFYPQAL